MKFRLLPLILIVYAGAVQAAGGWLIFPSVFYNRSYLSDNGPETRRSEFNLDTRVLHRWDNGLAVGGILSSTSGSGNNSYALTQTGLGATIAYLPGNWVITASYLPVVNREEKLNSNITTRNEGSGIHLEGGYMFSITPTLLVGPTLNFSQVMFKRQKFNTQNERDYTWRQEEWTPFLAAIFML